MVLYSVMVCYATHMVGSQFGNPLRMLGYEKTCLGSSMMTLVVGILVCIAWLVPYPNDIGGKDCILMLNITVNSAWSARE